jgi:hypothetical protein
VPEDLKTAELRREAVERAIRGVRSKPIDF